LRRTLHDHWPVVATLQERSSRSHIQPRLWISLRVALGAMRVQNWLDIAFEDRRFVSRQAAGGRQRDRGQDHAPCEAARMANLESPSTSHLDFTTLKPGAVT